MTRKNRPDMTYNVFGGTLNPMLLLLPITPKKSTLWMGTSEPLNGMAQCMMLKAAIFFKIIDRIKKKFIFA